MRRNGWSRSSECAVKAVSRRRRGPQARLYRACHPAIFGHRGRRLTTTTLPPSPFLRRFTPPVTPELTTTHYFVSIVGSRTYAYSRVDEIKSIPFVPVSHPFVERLIGTIRREFLDHVLIWNAIDLGRKLEEFRNYYNESSGSPVAQRPHSGRTIWPPTARPCRPRPLRLGAPLPRSIPDADSSVSYKFAMDRVLQGARRGRCSDMPRARRNRRCWPMLSKKSPLRSCRIEMRNNRTLRVGLLNQCCAS